MQMLRGSSCFSFGRRTKSLGECLQMPILSETQSTYMPVFYSSLAQMVD
jgi:hypothetical protein